MKCLFVALLCLCVWACMPTATKAGMSIPLLTKHEVAKSQAGDDVELYNRIMNAPSPSTLRRASAYSDATTMTAPNGYSSRLYGNITVAEYYVNMYVGGQGPFYVQLDSGSGTLALPGPSCTACVRVPTVYNMSASPTSSPLPCSKCPFTCSNDNCQVKETYGDGSFFQGRAVSDTTTIDNQPSFLVNLLFVAIDVIGGFFSPFPVQGIMGVAYNSTNGGNPTYFDVLTKSKSWPNVYAICLHLRGGGMVDIGHVVPWRHTTPIQYTPVTTQYYFQVNMNKLGWSSGGKSYWQSAASVEVIVDSGTTLANFAALGSKQVEMLRTNFPDLPYLANATILGPDFLYFPANTLTATDVALYPDLVMTFPDMSGQGEFTISIPASSYLVFDDTQWLIPIQFSESGNQLFIADTLMRSMYTVFDKEQNAVGFALSDRTACYATSDPNTSNSPSSKKDGLVIGIVVALVVVASMAGVYVVYQRRKAQAEPQVGLLQESSGYTAL